MEIKNILTVSKSAVTERDLNLIVMTETKKMVMVAAAIVKYKKDGTAKEVLVLKLVLVFLIRLLDHLLH